MKPLTELRIMVEQKETYFDKYINSLMAGNIKNLTIKEEWIMLEELKKARAEYAAEVERLLARNLDEVVNARFELVREQIAQEVKAEFDDQLAKAQLNVEHYDFVIAKMEEKALAQLAEETETDIVENDNIENVEA